MSVFRLNTVALATVMGGLLAAPASAQITFKNALELEPSNEWSVREYDDKCRLRRKFGEGEDASSLWIDRGSSNPVFNVTLIGRPYRTPYGDYLAVQFGEEQPYYRSYLTARSSKGRPTLALFGVRLSPTEKEVEELSDYFGSDFEDYMPPAANYPQGEEADPKALLAQRTAAIEEIRFGRALRKPVVLKTGSLAEPLAMLEDCIQRLIKKIDAEGVAGSGARPTEVARWTGILQRNYPIRMLRAEQEARLQIDLTIGRNGKPSFCEATTISGVTSFNDSVCLNMLRHATFEPARNIMGEPVVGRYSTRVTFKLNR